MDRLRNPSVQSSFTLFLALLFSAAIPCTALADAAGRSGDSGATAGRDCTRCHTAGAAMPSVAFSGPQSVMASSTNVYTFTITGGPGQGAGLDVAATGGTLVSTSPLTKIKSLEITHNGAPAPFSGGSAAFTFSWTAPATAGTYTLYGAGLSTNSPAATPGDELGDGTALATYTITVNGGAANQSPVAVITGPTTGTVGTQLTFSGQNSTDPDGTISSYSWNFGDNSSGAGPTVSHGYAAAGTYTVTLSVTDNLGAVGTQTQQVTITTTNPTPTPVSANAGGPYSGTIGSAILFDGSQSTGSIASYNWTFSDGTTASGATAAKTFLTAGTFNVILTVIDNKNATAQAFTVANITDPNATPADPTAGEELYAANCAECHGDGGVGGPAGDVVGESAEEIIDAIEDVDEMGFLADVLSEDDINAIAEYLQSLGDDDDEEEEDLAAFGASTGETKGRGRTRTASKSGTSTASLDILSLVIGGGLVAAGVVRRRRDPQ